MLLHHGPVRRGGRRGGRRAAACQSNFALLVFPTLERAGSDCAAPLRTDYTAERMLFPLPARWPNRRQLLLGVCDVQLISRFVAGISKKGPDLHDITSGLFESINESRIRVDKF